MFGSALLGQNNMTCTDGDGACLTFWKRKGKKFTKYNKSLFVCLCVLNGSELAQFNWNKHNQLDDFASF